MFLEAGEDHTKKILEQGVKDAEWELQHTCSDSHDVARAKVRVAQAKRKLNDYRG